MSLRIAPGLAPQLRPEAAALYWQAFGGKLGRVMGPERRALGFIESVLDESHVISALDGSGALAGVVGYRTGRGSFVGGDMADLAACYGRAGSWWRAACLQLLAQDIAPGTMLVDGLAVRADWRGQGVGAGLLNALCAEAARRHYRELRLEVVDENPRARALYERLGFLPVARRESRLTGIAFEFRAVTVMRRAL